MSRRGAVKGLAIAGAASAVAAAAWAVERSVSRRRRAAQAHDADDVVLRPITFAAASVPTHDGGTINYIDTGAATRRRCTAS